VVLRLVLHYVKSVFFDSQVTVAVLSKRAGSIFATTGLPPVNITQSEAGEILTRRADRRRQEFRQPDCRIHRMMAHGILQPGVRVRRIWSSYGSRNDELKPDAWKGIQHHELGQGRSRSEQLHEDVAA